MNSNLTVDRGFEKYDNITGVALSGNILYENNIHRRRFMGKLIRNLLDSLKLTDEDDEFEDEDYNTVSDNNRKKETVPKRENPPLRKYEEPEEDENDDDDDDEPLAQRRTFTRPQAPVSQNTFRQSAQTQTRTAVPLRSSISERRIYILNPKSFEDAREVCETLKNGGVIFMNFENVKTELAQRLMDFAGGSVYALGGQIYQISGFSFIVAPGDTDIEGDILAQITSAGAEFPIFTRV